jgi:carbon-monoxide dehydrogenase large subunit
MVLSQTVGASIKRREDPRLVTGHGQYVDDVRLPGTLYLAFVRSPHAHARVGRIDTAAALQQPGVAAVFTHADCDLTLTTHAALNPQTPPPPRPLLAGDTVRFVGEAVAVVLADDRYVARDAADLVEVDYEPLPAAASLQAALADGAPLVHEAFPGNVYLKMERNAGDWDAAVAQAARVVRLDIFNQRVNSLPMEPRAALAEYRRYDETLTVWSSNQVPHTLRSALAAQLTMPESRVRVIAPDVGGGFGSKLNVYPEEVLTAWAAKRLGQPVKWVEERRESLLTLSHGRGQIDEVEAAVAADGKVLGLRARVVGDLGAHLLLFTALIPVLTINMLVGPYDITVVASELTEVFTHCAPTDAHRGAGRPEATFLLERLMDRIAAELTLDPADVRRRNFVQPSQFPYTSAVGSVYDSGNYAGALDKALQVVNYQHLREEQRRLRGGGRYLGIGLGSYVELTGVGPSRGFGAPVWEAAVVRAEPDGTVTVISGAPSQGQGHETSFAQIVAGELGVPYESVRVLSGDTAVGVTGIGTFGSRSMPVAGGAIVGAAARVREKALQVAAALLEAAPEDLEYRDGQAIVRGQPGKMVTFQQIANAAYAAFMLPPEIEPGLEATMFFDPPNMTYPFGTHVCVVEVDPRSGEVQILRFVAVDDAGRIINPLLAAGQLHGGIAQGIGQALYEEIVYDEDGQLRTASLMDYALPTADKVPHYELDHTETPGTTNPLGAKGIGEAGTIGSTPAVVNAVLDALLPLGVTHIDMPLKPERIWRAIRGQQDGAEEAAVVDAAEEAPDTAQPRHVPPGQEGR